MMSPRIPTTVHGLNLFECLSGLQKCIRRGLERQAMLFACELGHTSKGFATAVGDTAVDHPNGVVTVWYLDI